jgi:hypothetical protein
MGWVTVIMLVVDYRPSCSSLPEDNESLSPRG